MPAENQDRLRLVTSRQNALVKDLRRALTQAELTDDGHCAIEGAHILEEAIRSGLRVKAVFFSQSAQDRAQRLLPQISTHAETILLPDDVFKSAVATETPQGVAALVKPRALDLSEALAVEDPFLIGAAGIQDPGNFGTIIRSAEAFGAAAVIAIDKTVSPLNSKVIRGSSGSIFRLPVVKRNAAEVIGELKDAGVRILATSSHKGTPLPEIDLTGSTCVFVGSEGAGVPREVLAAADETLFIPQSPKVESLNAGVAASIILYEAARQRGTVK